jgi:hypothetical protein
MGAPARRQPFVKFAGVATDISVRRARHLQVPALAENALAVLGRSGSPMISFHNKPTLSKNVAPRVNGAAAGLFLDRREAMQVSSRCRRSARRSANRPTMLSRHRRGCISASVARVSRDDPRGSDDGGAMRNSAIFYLATGATARSHRLFVAFRNLDDAASGAAGRDALRKMERGSHAGTEFGSHLPFTFAG